MITAHGLEVQVIPRDTGQIQFALVPHIRRIAGVGVALAVNEDAVLPSAGGDQQAAEAAGLLAVPGELGPGGDEGGLGQQVRLKAAVFRFRQDNLPHHRKRCGLDDGRVIGRPCRPQLENKGVSLDVLQRLADPASGQCGIGIRDLDAGSGVALQHSGQHRGAAASKGVQDPSARLGDLHDVPHELQGLFRQVDAVLGIAVLEHARQAGHGPVDGHVPVGSPDDVLRLLAEASLLGPAVALVPDGSAAPDPARPLEGVRSCGELPPVDEHAHRSARLAGFPGIVQPLRRPPGPGPLVLGVAIKGRRGMVAHTGVFLRRGFVLFRLGAPAGCVGRVCNHRVEGPRRKAGQHLQRVALDDFPLGVIAHRQVSPSFLCSFAGADPAPFGLSGQGCPASRRGGSPPTFPPSRRDRRH